MTDPTDQVKVYQLRVYLQKINPMVWRRLLVRSDRAIADLHYTLQIAMGRDDFHLHQFIIRGKRYGEFRMGGILFSDNPCRSRLGDFRFRLKERFLYECDFTDGWQHEIRIENELPLDPQKAYPVCLGGVRAAPPEDCGGPWAFMALKQQHSMSSIADRLIEIIEQKGGDDCREELHEYQYWLRVDKFDRQAANRNFIPNYGERYRYGENISTAFVESPVNEVISKRMVKKQQTRWTKQRAHLLLQVRVQTLNGDLRNTFRKCYPGMTPESENLSQTA